MISWAGDDPTREGLLDTPERVARAYEEWFAGYNEVPSQLLERCFEEIAGYDEIVLLRDIRFESHCEHHVAPIIGCSTRTLPPFATISQRLLAWRVGLHQQIHGMSNSGPIRSRLRSCFRRSALRLGSTSSCALKR